MVDISDSSATKTTKSGHQVVVLIPQPSNDPKDPLVCSSSAFNDLAFSISLVALPKLSVQLLRKLKSYHSPRTGQDVKNTSHSSCYVSPVLPPEQEQLLSS